MPSEKSRQWAIVLSKDLSEELEEFEVKCANDPDLKVDFFQVQEEESPSGHPHFQAVLALRQQLTTNQVKALFTKDKDKSVHVRVELARDLAALSVYCSKFKTRVPNGHEFKYGAIPSVGDRSAAGRLRKRGVTGTTAEVLSKANETNLTVAKRMCMGMSFTKALEGEDPNALFRSNTIKTAVRELQQAEREKLSEEWLAQQTLRPWQEELVDLMDSNKDNRTVLVVYDEVGKQGKSFLLNYMDCKYGDKVLSVGGTKMNDALYAASKCPIMGPEYIFMDLSRTLHKQEGEEGSRSLINYDLLERLINGFFISGKYDSTKVRWTTPRVACIFTNQHLNYGAMSMDRWKVYELCEGRLGQVDIAGASAPGFKRSMYNA
jgi:hypothetical protein